MQKIKERNIFFRLAGILLIVFSIVGCSVFNNDADSISFFIDEENIEIGNILDLQYEVVPKTADTDNVLVVFNDDSLVEQDENGNYIAVNEGTLKASIISDDITYDLKTIHINPIEVKYIGINGFDLGIGRSAFPEVNILPLNSTHKDYILSSSDDNIARVEGKKVIAVSEGIATITVQSADGPTAECDVKVFEVIPDYIEIQGSKKDIETDDELRLSIKYSPVDVTNKEVKWSSSNSRILKVDEDGKVTAVSAGTATIVASFSNSIEDSVEITVSYPPASSISISAKSDSLYTGKTMKLGVTFVPSKVNDDYISWESSNYKVANVDKDGIVTGLSVGTALITAKTVNNKEASFLVEVKSAPVVVRSSVGSGASSSNSGGSGEMVWLSATGSKYHRINHCGNMDPDRARQVTLEYAVQNGYGACKKCY